MATTFEELTLTNLRSRVLRKLRVGDTARYSPTKGEADYDWVDEALNEGLKTFVRETKCIRTYAVYVLKNAYQFYRLPEQYIDVKAVYYYDSALAQGWKELEFKTLEELNDEVSDWRNETGDPKFFCVDRMFGRRWFIGFVPIPDSDGSTVTIADSTTYGQILTADSCPNDTYSEERIQIFDGTTTKYIWATAANIPPKFANLQGDVVLEYYRLPKKLENTVQYPELPREYHTAIADYAAFELLRDNPEDSAEFKRAPVHFQIFQGAVASFKTKRKDNVSKARPPTARAAAPTWYTGMDYYKDIP